MHDQSIVSDNYKFSPSSGDISFARKTCLRRVGEGTGNSFSNTIPTECAASASVKIYIIYMSVVAVISQFIVSSSSCAEKIIS